MRALRFLLVIALAFVLLSPSVLSAAEKPSSVIHIVTLRWKDGTSDAQIKEALAGLEKAASMYNGITRLWLRPIGIQGAPIGKCEGCRPITHIFVMEFASEDALKKYRNSDAQKEFYKVYIPLRDESRTHDITN